MPDKLSSSYEFANSTELLIDALNDDAQGDGLTEKTRRQYTLKLRTISKRIRKLKRMDGTQSLKAEDFAFYLENEAEEGAISEATFRFHRSAILFWIRRAARDMMDRGEALGSLPAIYRRVVGIRNPGLPKKTNRTSAQRIKGFPPELIDRIENFIRSQDHQPKHADSLVAFLRANLILGLRPTEWFDIAFANQYDIKDEDRSARSLYAKGQPNQVDYSPEHAKLALYVGNAKTTHNRANGLYRIILLDRLSRHDLKIIMRFRNIVSNYLDQASTPKDQELRYKGFFKGMQITLVKALKQLGIKPGSPEWVTLYSTRHQAIANAKKAKFSAVELSALFGHASVRTVIRHYASGSRGVAHAFRCRPDPTSIEQVRRQEPSSERVRARQAESIRLERQAWLDSEQLFSKKVGA